jgi:TetR/AcrR family transcriptional regulator
MNQFLDRIESSVKQSFRTAASNAELPQQFDAAARSALVIAFVVGRWHRFAKTGFRKAPTENIDAQLPVLLV